MSKKISLRELLLEKKLFNTIREAELEVRLGKVYVNGQKVLKPNELVNREVVVELKQGDKYVSRAGLKLEKALSKFEVTVVGKSCLDIGAAKGGFTDCLLQNGAKKIIALEKSRSQLSSHLDDDPRVINLKETDFRDIPKLSLKPFDLITVDVSFTSLEKVFDSIIEVVESGTQIITLIKPGYEVKKPGVEDTVEFYSEIIDNLVKSVDEWVLVKLTYSPILGKKKKAIEFLGLWEHDGDGVDKDDVKKVISEALKTKGL